jgi:hypothetical protein
MVTSALRGSVPYGVGKRICDSDDTSAFWRDIVDLVPIMVDFAVYQCGADVLGVEFP